MLHAQLVWPVSESAAYAADVGQVAHTGEPGSVEYEPALQFVHAPPKVENWPGAHGRQAPDEREEPAGHAVAEAEGDGDREGTTEAEADLDAAPLGVAVTDAAALFVVDGVKEGGAEAEAEIDAALLGAAVEDATALIDCVAASREGAALSVGAAVTLEAPDVEDDFDGVGEGKADLDPVGETVVERDALGEAVDEGEVDREGAADAEAAADGVGAALGNTVPVSDETSAALSARA